MAMNLDTHTTTLSARELRLIQAIAGSPRISMAELAQIATCSLRHTARIIAHLRACGLLATNGSQGGRGCKQSYRIVTSKETMTLVSQNYDINHDTNCDIHAVEPPKTMTSAPIIMDKNYDTDSDELTDEEVSQRRAEGQARIAAWEARDRERLDRKHAILAKLAAQQGAQTTPPKKLVPWFLDPLYRDQPGYLGDESHNTSAHAELSLISEIEDRTPPTMDHDPTIVISEKLVTDQGSSEISRASLDDLVTQVCAVTGIATVSDRLRSLVSEYAPFWEARGRSLVESCQQAHDIFYGNRPQGTFGLRTLASFLAVDVKRLDRIPPMVNPPISVLA